MRVRWRRFGTDDRALPPLVLLHGGHGSWMHWLRNVEALSADRTLWLPDMPGFQRVSTRRRAAAPARPRSTPCSTRSAARSTSLIGAGTPIDLGGFSFGGLTAAKFAVRRGSHPPPGAAWAAAATARCGA